MLRTYDGELAGPWPSASVSSLPSFYYPGRSWPAACRDVITVERTLRTVSHCLALNSRLAVNAKVHWKSKRSRTVVLSDTPGWNWLRLTRAECVSTRAGCVTVQWLRCGSPAVDTDRPGLVGKRPHRIRRWMLSNYRRNLLPPKWRPYAQPAQVEMLIGD